MSKLPSLLVAVALFLLALTFAPAASLANPIPPNPAYPADIQSILLSCNESWITPGESRVRYRYVNNPEEIAYEQDPDGAAPEGSYCGWFVSNLGGQTPVSDTDTGGQVVEVSAETLAWWQATIDILQTAVSLGAKIYPVILGIRVVSMVVYS